MKAEGSKAEGFDFITPTGRRLPAHWLAAMAKARRRVKTAQGKRAAAESLVQARLLLGGGGEA